MSWPAQSGNKIRQTYIQGFLDISGGDVTIRNKGSLYVGNNIDICGNISIGGNSRIIGNSIIEGNIDIKNNSTILANSSIQGNSSVQGNSTISGNLLVNSNTKLRGNLVIGNNISSSVNYLFDLSYNNSSIQSIPAPSFFINNNLEITNQTQNLVFQNDSYTALSSSNALNAFNAFNGSTTNSWNSSANYNVSGAHNGNSQTFYLDNDTTYTINGEWLQISLPYYLTLTSFSIASISSNSPKYFYIFGSNQLDNTPWIYIYDNYGTILTNPFQSNYSINYTPDNSLPFKNFRLVVNSTYNTTSVKINQFNLFGIPSVNQEKIPNVFWWNYGNSTYDLLDSSFSSIDTSTYVPGLSNSSLYLRGNNYLVLPKISLYNCSGFSICFWIKFNTIDIINPGKIFELNTIDGQGPNAQISLDTSFNIYKNNNDKQFINFIPTVNTWYHISICHSSITNSIIFYMNGFKNQQIDGIIFSYSDYFINYLGRTNASTVNTNNLYISDYRIYNSNLTSFQINAIYNTNKTINTNNLLSYHFNDAYFGSNMNIYNDVSMNGNLNIVSGNIITSGSTATANIFTTNTGKISLGTNSGNIFVGKTGSGTVFFNNDISMNGKINVVSGNIYTTDSIANIFTSNAGKISLGTSSGNIFIGENSSTGTVFFNNDISMNGKINIVSGNIYTTGSTADIFTSNEDKISLGTSSDNIFVGKAGSGSVFFNNDISMNGKINVVSGNIYTTGSTADIFTSNTGDINIGTNSDNIFVGKNQGKVILRNSASDISMTYFYNGDLYLPSGNNYSGGRIYIYNDETNLTGWAGGIFINKCEIYSPSIKNNLGSALKGLTINGCDSNGNITTRNVCINDNLICSNTVSAVSFNATSDYRIKENIREIPYTVDNLKPIHYTNKNTKKDDIGLIAHELQEIIPFLVTGEKDGIETQTINYIGLIGVLIKEIQDLKKRVSILEETQK